MNFASLLLNVPDANLEILGQPRYEGAINSISGLTDIMDSGFVMYITFIAFFIISVAMLRNVLAGAYVAYPKFWDKVAEAHDEKREMAYYERVTGFFKEGWKSASGGSLEKFILQFVPNVKLWTDFAEADGNDIAPKDYFMKAIPQMILVIIIGVFIYNGYYRDTADKITGVGADLFHRFITEVDPTEVIYRITESSGTPEFASDDSEDRQMQLINKVSHDAYAAILSKYNDIDSTAAKTQLAASIENWVTDCIETNASKYASNERWEPKYKLTLTTAPSRQKDSSSADGQTKVIVLGTVNVKDFGFESTIAADETWYLNAVATFNKQTVKKNITQLADIKLRCKFSKGVDSIEVSSDVGSILNAANGRSTLTAIDTQGNECGKANFYSKSDRSGTPTFVIEATGNGDSAKQSFNKFKNVTVHHYVAKGVTISLANHNHTVIEIYPISGGDNETFSSKTAARFSKGWPITKAWPDDIFSASGKDDEETSSADTSAE